MVYCLQVLSAFSQILNSGNLCSNDCGSSWIRSGLIGHRINAVAQNSKGTLFAATLDGSDDIIIYNQNGIWRSEDFGTSWIYIPNYFYTEALIIDKEDVIYRADYAEFTPQGVFRSKDNGYTWEQINSGINYYDKAIKEFALSKDGYLFARGYKGFIYRSVEPV